MNKKHTILIAPLEWGLGHATRMIPVATRLAGLGHTVYIASGEEHLDLFRRELPGINCIVFPGFKPSYSALLPQYVAMLLRLPALLFHSTREHRELGRLISQYNISVVISDNRFGLWTRKVSCAYFTHMPRIPFPRPFRFLEGIGIWLHCIIIRRYDLCLIPDLPAAPGLSGRLSHGLKLPGNVRFTGPLSRFPAPGGASMETPVKGPYITIILSGPEPQRSVFRKKALQLLSKEEKTIVVLEGRPAQAEIREEAKLVSFSHPPSALMETLLRNSCSIVARAGYSTVSDLMSLGLSALLVPTPGQTEQEYLAGQLERYGWFKTCSQRKMDKSGQLPPVKMEEYPDTVSPGRELLAKALEELLEYGDSKDKTGKPGQVASPGL